MESSSDLDKVRLYPTEKHDRYLQTQFLQLNRTEQYMDTRIVCRDGTVSVNFLIAAFAFPELFTVSVSSLQQEWKTIIVPDMREKEVEHKLNQLLQSERIVEQSFVKTEQLKSNENESFDDGNYLSDNECATLDDGIGEEEEESAKPCIELFTASGRDLYSCSKCGDRLQIKKSSAKLKILLNHLNVCRGELGNAPNNLDTVSETELQQHGQSIIWKYFSQSSSLSWSENMDCNLCFESVRCNDNPACLLQHLKRYHNDAIINQSSSSILHNPRTRMENFLLRFLQTTASDSPSFSCEFCDFSISSKHEENEIFQHLLKKHKIEMCSICVQCNQKISDERTTGQNDSKIVCAQCDLCYHNACVNLQNSNWCLICSTSSEVTKKKKSPKSSSTVCPECGKEYKDINGHIRRFHADSEHQSQVQCELCRRFFKRKCNLSEHMKMVHQKMIRFHCEFCQRGFYNRAQLRRHVRIMHMNEKSEGQVTCPECGKEMLKSTLKKHLRNIHQGIKTDDRAFCEDCGKQFTQKGSLFIHMRKAHGKEPDINVNKSNHNKSRFFVDPQLISEAYPDLKPSS